MNPEIAAPGRRALFLELAVVMLVAWVPPFVSSLYQRVDPLPRTLETDVFGAIQDLGCVALMLFLPWRAGESLRHFALRKVRWGSEPLWGILIFICGWLVYAFIFRLTQDVETADRTVQAAVAPTSTLHRTLLPFFLVISAFFEELLFRGYLWDRLRRLTGRTSLAFGISTVLFTAYHPYRLLSLVYILGAGVMLGLFRLKGRSLPRLVLGHALFNMSIYYGR